MLDHLRLEADAMPVRFGRVRVDDILKAVAFEHAPTAQAKAIRVVVRSRPIEVLADEHLLRRIVGNLLTNGLRHSNGGRVALIVASRLGALEIRVVDDGIGIAVEEHERLFDDFVQGGGPSAPASGFGLGLASARRMARLMGGTLELDPSRRRGAAFILRLPCDPVIAA